MQNDLVLCLGQKGGQARPLSPLTKGLQVSGSPPTSPFTGGGLQCPEGRIWEGPSDLDHLPSAVIKWCLGPGAR